MFCYSVESQTRWTQIGELLSEKKFRFETDDLVRYDQQNNEIFYIGRRTLTLKRFGVMINFEYIEQVRRISSSAVKSEIVNCFRVITFNIDYYFRDPNPSRDEYNVDDPT